MQVVHRPSIGRYTKLEEPKARESLLTPAMRRSMSQGNLSGKAKEDEIKAAASSSSLTVDAIMQPSKDAISAPPSSTIYSPIPKPLIQASTLAFMERTPFAIDDAKDEDDESEDEVDGEDNDDQVLDEVCGY